MKKKKIFIHIHQSILKGGVEKVFHNIINNLPIEEYDISVLNVMGYLTDDFEGQLYPLDVKRNCLMWDELSHNPWKRLTQKIHNRLFPWYYKNLVLRFKKFDVAIAAQEGFYAKYVMNNVRAKKKMLWIHNDMTQCHWTKKQFGDADQEKACYEKFDKVVCVSKGVAESMRRVFGSMDNLTVCYNPIDTHEIDRKLKEKLASRPEELWFVCAGRLVYQKAYDRLFEVCKRLNDDGFRYRITILGEGSDRPILENMIKDYGLANIELIGNQSNPFKYIKAADWYLLPSRHEGFGLVLHEAVWCGTPIITTDVVGARELLGDSEFGIVTENSEEGIYNTLCLVLRDPHYWEKYRNAVKRRASFINLEQRILRIKELF